MTLASGGGGVVDLPACGLPASFSVHLASSSVSGGVCPLIQGWQCGAHVGAVEELICVLYVSVTEEHSGDGCDLASTWCKYDLTQGDLFFSELGNGATSEARKYLFRAADEWWRCAQYFVIASCG